MDFIRIYTKMAKNNSGKVEVCVDFKLHSVRDLMVRGKSFYAVYDEEKGLWSKNEFDVVRLVDTAIFNKVSELEANGYEVVFPLMTNFESGLWMKYTSYVKNMPDNWTALDSQIYFDNITTTRQSYATKKLPYSLVPGDISHYDQLMSVLYTQPERAKLEWAVGAILTGDSKKIQKFITLYGSSGTGKSTFLNILQKIVEGYYISFNAKDLVGRDAFGMEVFKSNPLVAIQHDGDLSRIEDNSTLNSIISHEEIVMNEKHKSKYPIALNCFLFLGTNKPVSISDSKSGLIRRLIDVVPSGNKVSTVEYIRLVQGINFELGAIAHHCISVYRSMGENYYQNYVPQEMMFETNTLYNFVFDHALILSRSSTHQVKQLYDMYKTYCEDTGEHYPMKRRQFRAEMKAYFEEFHDIGRDDEGRQMRSVYKNFKSHMFEPGLGGDLKHKKGESAQDTGWIQMGSNESIFDIEYADRPAQYAGDAGTPMTKWDNCDTVLNDIDTSRLHYVAGLDTQHIVVDFDLKDEMGNKSLEMNLAAANKWPETYAELSKSGQGIHLHYIWAGGDAADLERLYSDGIEVKVFTGNSSLRRMVSLCNTLPIAIINSGLKIKERKGGSGLIDKKRIDNEKHLRVMIKKCMNKEHHGATKPEVDFIFKLLEDASSSKMIYDVSDMRPGVLAFAAGSTNNAEYCIDLVNRMKWKSESSEEIAASRQDRDDSDIVFYDVEVAKNLFVVVYKMRGKDKKLNNLVNPTPQQIAKLFEYKLVGYNNKRYDDHILYGAYLGYTNEQLYNLSKSLIGKKGDNKFSGFREAYSIAYTDIYDFSTKKQSLKKWEIELGLKHNELDVDWDEPIPEDMWSTVVEYCGDDVLATESVFEHLSADWKARKILADIAGLTYNHTTNQLTIAIVFRGDRSPELEYTYLEETFPGYSYTRGPDNKFRNMYRGVDLGKGGYVYAEPGFYRNVAVLDVESMHPTSIIVMRMFGKYTKNFEELKVARISIKHGDLAAAAEMFDGKLRPYLDDPDDLDGLSYALKIAINSAYGLTSASFPNAMRDDRNVNNIVALRGALFMKTLQDEVQARGYQVIHIKTDSIKIPDASQDIIDFCYDFAERYGYKFEHEATYDKICLVNNAVFIAKYGWAAKAKKVGTWSATGAQFAEPYVFKKLFSKEPIEFKDFAQVRSVSHPASIKLDFNEDLPDGEHNYHFIGRVGSFVPVMPGTGGAEMVRIADGKVSAVNDTKGYRWKEADVVRTLEQEDTVDLLYYNTLVDDAIKNIEKYCPIEDLVDSLNGPIIMEQEDLIGFDEVPPEQAVAQGMRVA